ncbi:MAG: hypothetical protein JWP48_549 [Actinoallomurus sp.]|nr:hypothetical protein [Actinoallomurus sp.]
MNLSGRVLDVPALVDLATGRSQHMRALVGFVADRGYSLVAPATALAKAAAVTDERGLQELAWAVESASVVVLALDARNAFVIGDAARQAGIRDVVDAHIARAAADRGWPIVTSAEAAVKWRTLGLAVQSLP